MVAKWMKGSETLNELARNLSYNVHRLLHVFRFHGKKNGSRGMSVFFCGRETCHFLGFLIQNVKKSLVFLSNILLA